MAQAVELLSVVATHGNPKTHRTLAKPREVSRPEYLRREGRRASSAAEMMAFMARTGGRVAPT